MTLQKLMKDKTGSVSIFGIGLVFLLFLLTFLIMEMGAVYENYDYCVDVLQRSCNSAVEKNIDDSYRADKMLKLNTAQAAADFQSFVAADLSERYGITVERITCTETPPSMTVSGQLRFSTLFAQYGWDDLTFDFKIRATNYDLE